MNTCLRGLARLPAALIALSSPSLGESITRVTLSHSNYSICVTGESGRIKCFGLNDSGQLGPREATQMGGFFLTRASLELAPLDLDYATHGGVKQLVLSAKNACALMSDGKVLCWGSESDGIFLNPNKRTTLTPADFGKSLRPVPLGNGEDPIEQLSAGTDYVCALFHSGGVKCWGANNNGQLGVSSQRIAAEMRSPDDPMPFVNLGTGLRAIQVASANHHNCVLFPKDRVKCWGRDQDSDGDQKPDGVLGFPTTGSDIGDDEKEMGDALPFVPLHLSGGEHIERLYAGSTFNCVLTRKKRKPAGRVLCWGSNHRGQLGAGDKTPRGYAPEDFKSLPEVDLALAPDDQIEDLSLGDASACARLKSGRLKCWGDNTGSILGDGTSTDRGTDKKDMGANLPYIDIGPGLEASQLDHAGYYSCVLVKAVQAIKCWGYDFSQLIDINNLIKRGQNPSDMGNNLPYIEIAF